MTERIFAFILLFSLVSPLTFERHQSFGEQFEQAASFAKQLKPYSEQICQDGHYHIGTSIGVKNNLKNHKMLMYLGKYSNRGYLGYREHEQRQLIKPKQNMKWTFSRGPYDVDSHTNGFILFHMLDSLVYLAIIFENASSAHVCARANVNPRTLIKDIKANSYGCISFTNSEYSSKQGILYKPGYSVSVNANYEENDGCKVQQIAVVLK